ncbi:MAG: Pyridoxal-phosphate dependent enzyme [Chloroflexi bacterium]|nr:Pyridoxal-phosphate dependent enzyme [Chloroflexota bacterium]
MTTRIDDLPRFPLLQGPSPLHRLERLGAALGGRAELWIKREDLLPLAFGGNKLRNLEFIVGAALATGADTLVTAGRRWSNHCRLTAAAGARAGLAVHLILSGPPARGPDGSPVEGPGAMLDALLGATVHQLPTADREDRDAAVRAAEAELRANGRRPFSVPVGGSGLPGVAGQVLAAAELLEQAGTSAAVVLGVLVARRDEELRPAIVTMLAELGPLTGAHVPASEVVLDGSLLGDGYGVRTRLADDAAALLARTEGILVDPIYTAKALAGLIAGVRSGAWDGRQVVFWHAGGTPGLFEPLDEEAVPALAATLG